MITRRKLLTVSAIGLAVMSVAPGMVWAKHPHNAEETPEGSAKENFRALLHTPFCISHGFFDRSEVGLVEVADGPISPKTDQFSLTFQGPRSRPLAEGLYDFSHPKMGRFQLYLKPAGSDLYGAYYNAVFSLLV